MADDEDSADVSLNYDEIKRDFAKKIVENIMNYLIRRNIQRDFQKMKIMEFYISL